MGLSAIDKKIVFLVVFFVAFSIGGKFTLGAVTEVKTECGLFDCYTNLHTSFNIPTQYIGRDISIKKLAENIPNSYLVKHKSLIRIGRKLKETDRELIRNMRVKIIDKNTIQVYGKIEGASKNKWGLVLSGDRSFENSTWWNSSYETRYPIENVSTEFKLIYLGTGNYYGIANGINNETTYLYNDTDTITYAVANETDEYCYFESINKNKSCPLRDNSLIDYWTLDESSGDVWDSINNNNGVVTATQNINSIVNKGIEFDGSTTDRITLTKNFYDLGWRDKGSICFWFKMNTDYDTSKDHYLFGDWYSDLGSNMRINANSGTLSWYVYPNNHRITTTNTITADTWYFLCGISDGSNMYLYLNGNLWGSTTTSGDSMGDSSKKLNFGNTGTDTIKNSIDGIMDDIRIYNRSLSSEEISNLYSSISATLGSGETLDTTPPTFSNWQQQPPDLNSSSLGKLYINVTINDTSGVNDSSVKFYHWINDTQYPDEAWCFLNGTAGDFEHEHEMTNTSSLFNITLHTYAYNPSTHNVHPNTMSSATKYNYSLDSNNDALKVRFYNISTHPNTTYVLKPRLYRNSGNLLIYYCNESYTSGKVYSSDYCTPLTTLTSQAGTNYQNTYFYGDENSMLDGVKITSTGYIVFYAGIGSDWEVVYANIDSNSLETTGNGGTSWTNQDFSADTWLIQLNGNGLTTVGYKVYACDMLGNCGNSTVQEDSYAIHNLAPSPAPEIIVPENNTYSGTFNITWTASKDPNNDPFNYSLYLYQSNGALADVLANNNITEGTEYYTFDSTNYPDGQYYLMANATDNESNTNFYVMPYLFTIDNVPPTTTTTIYIPPTPIQIPDNTQKDLIMIFLVALFIMIFFFLPFSRR